MEPKLSLILLIVTIFASKVLSQPAVPRSVIEANSNRGQQGEPLTLYDLHRMLYKRNADLLSDPRFINCIEEMNGAVDNQDAMAFYAKCFSFVGRPSKRFFWIWKTWNVQTLARRQTQFWGASTL